MSIITSRSQLAPQNLNISQPGQSNAAQRSSLFARLRGWLENDRARRELAHCLALDPRFARDIGLSPNDVHSISSAPFWVGITRLK